MSHTGGGLAQMSYKPSNHFDKGLGVPATGFASRRGGEVFNRRMSAAPPANISTINEAQSANTGATPRTSRSHLLAGLRTAPKSPVVPSSAPPSQIEQPSKPELPRGGIRPTTKMRNNAPHTAVGTTFGNQAHQQGGLPQANGMYGLPEILAPPEIPFTAELDPHGMDSEEYANLMVHGQQLAQQQYLLQQQLLNLTMAQQQMQTLNIGAGMNPQQQQSYMQTAGMAPPNGFYYQQLRNGLQPIVNPVPGTPGLYSVYNPMTGQSNLMVDESAQIASPPQSTSPTSPAAVRNPHDLAHSPPPMTPTFRAQVSPPPESNDPVRMFGSPTPPKSVSPPADTPSHAAQRRSHIKQLSSITGLPSKPMDGPRSAVPRTAGFPATPQTGTFGPGQSRIGDHPIRQPRGPPSLEDLKEKPTAKHEGSKNFVTRQRRRALNSLVRAGVERRGASQGSNSADTPASGTPSSECEITFSASSDADTESVHSSKSGSQHGAIGSERKKLQRDPASREKLPAMGSFFLGSGNDEVPAKPTAAQNKFDEIRSSVRRDAPMMVLTSALEKRRSGIM